MFEGVVILAVWIIRRKLDDTCGPNWLELKLLRSQALVIPATKSRPTQEPSSYG